MERCRPSGGGWWVSRGPLSTGDIYWDESCPLTTDIIAIHQGHLLHTLLICSHPGLHPFSLLYAKETFLCIAESKAKYSS